MVLYIAYNRLVDSHLIIYGWSCASLGWTLSTAHIDVKPNSPTRSVSRTLSTPKPGQSIGLLRSCFLPAPAAVSATPPRRVPPGRARMRRVCQLRVMAGPFPLRARERRVHLSRASLLPPPSPTILCLRRANLPQPPRAHATGPPAAPFPHPPRSIPPPRLLASSAYHKRQKLPAPTNEQS